MAALSHLGQRKSRFAGLISRVPHSFARELFIEHRIEPSEFEALELQVRAYISACLRAGPRVLSCEEITARLSDARTDLPNMTPNGVLMPKAEVSLEFTMLHKSLAGIFAPLGIDAVADLWSLPVNVRVVLGEANPGAAGRPYAASKIHTDVWAGEPADTVVLNIPILGDIERTSLEWFEPPAHLGESYLRPLADFSEGESIARQSTRVSVAPKLGHVYFSDCALLHRTVRAAGGCRVSIDMRLRLESGADYRSHVEQLCGRARLDNYVPFRQWQAIGERSVMVFDETMEQARNRYRVPSEGYSAQLPYRLVEFACPP